MNALPYTTSIILILLLLLSAGALATIKPHALFSDNTVLQRGIDVPVWGWASDGEKVTVKFQGQTVSTTAKNGKWMVRLKPLDPGGPFTMTISGMVSLQVSSPGGLTARPGKDTWTDKGVSSTIEVKNVLVGEVWVCSGQSNMEWPLAETTTGKEAIAASRDPMIRLFSVPHNPQDNPIENVEAAWVECGPETVPSFSAVGYLFGRDLRKTLDVPIGLINTSWGGTVVQAWTSEKTAKTAPIYEAFLKAIPEWARDNNKPFCLFNGMIAPLIPYAIRGAIWYQGESNAGEAYRYRTLFPTMIRDWREEWKQGDFPFLFVQLAPFQKIVDQPQESDWAELREAQLLTAKNCVNTAMTVITDCGDPDDIHPKLKEPVGARLALAARAVAYSESLVYQGPLLESMQIKGDRAVLSFTSVGSGLMVKDGDLKGFTIAGADRKFHNAQSTIQGENRVVVHSPEVPNPVAVRYGWAYCPVVNLYNKEGIPASPFRTDDFPMVTK